MDKEKYLQKLKLMTNEELLEEYSQLHWYSPEDMTPSDDVDYMIDNSKKEILSRMI